MAWTTARDDLRAFLSDGTKNKYRWRKKLLGTVDGTNKTFKTFEKRRFTGTLTVYVNGTAATVTADDVDTGEVTLTNAPAVNAIVEGSYYAKFFLDDELDRFLLEGAKWLGYTTAASLPDGLTPACKHYGAQEAYHFLCTFQADTLAEQYRLEDTAGDTWKTVVDFYRKLGEDMRKKAEYLRDEYYKGKGQQHQALSTSLAGAVKEVAPNR